MATDYTDILEEVVALLEAQKPMQKRYSKVGKTQDRGHDKGYFHTLSRRRPEAHNPFSYAKGIGPGPRGQMRDDKDIWDCHSAGKYSQVCVNKKNGRKITVNVDPAWKKEYNREYRLRDFPRSLDDKNLMAPGREKEIDDIYYGNDKKGRGHEALPFSSADAKNRPRKGAKLTGTSVDDAALEKIKTKHLKKKMQQVAAGKKKTGSTGKPRTRRGSGTGKKPVTGVGKKGKQGEMFKEGVGLGTRQFLLTEQNERKAMKKVKKWIQKIKLQTGALRRMYDVPKGSTIPPKVWQQIERDKQELLRKSADGKLSDDERTALRRIILGLTFRKIAKSKAKMREDINVQSVMNELAAIESDMHEPEGDIDSELLRVIKEVI